MNVDNVRVGHRTTTAPSVIDAVLDVALAMRADGTWAGTSMERIASAVGMSRQTLYNKFRNRQGITQALLWRETDRLLAGVDLRWRRARERGESPADCLASTMNWMLAATRAHPLLHDILTGKGHQAAGLNPVPPHLTPADQPVISGLGLAGVVDAVTELCHRLDSAESDVRAGRLQGVDAVVRMTVSYLLLPTAAAEARSQIAYAARSLLPDSWN